MGDNRRDRISIESSKGSAQASDAQQLTDACFVSCHCQPPPRFLMSATLLWISLQVGKRASHECARFFEFEARTAWKKLVSISVAEIA